VRGSGGIRNDDDARLIAAAPELLEAGEKLIATVNGRGYPDGDRDAFYVALRIMEAAAAKARGEP
jgi:hypothetical protein